MDDWIDGGGAGYDLRFNHVLAQPFLWPKKISGLMQKFEFALFYTRNIWKLSGFVNEYNLYATRNGIIIQRTVKQIRKGEKRWILQKEV